MGAMISRTPIYMKAYGTPKTALIHGPATFGGIGEACCTAIEALNLLYDEDLIDNAAERGTTATSSGWSRRSSQGGNTSTPSSTHWMTCCHAASRASSPTT